MISLSGANAMMRLSELLRPVDKARLVLALKDRHISLGHKILMEEDVMSEAVSLGIVRLRETAVPEEE